MLMASRPLNCSYPVDEGRFVLISIGFEKGHLAEATVNMWSSAEVWLELMMLAMETAELGVIVLDAQAAHVKKRTF